MTWLMVIAGLLHLVGDLVMAFAIFAERLAAAGSLKPWAEIIADDFHRIGYSLVFFGTAATVEYLFRIWAELRIRRERADLS